MACEEGSGPRPGVVRGDSSDSKAGPGLKLLPRWLTHGCGQEVTARLRATTRQLASPNPGERSQDTAVPRMTQSQELNMVTSAIFCSLEASHCLQPTPRGRGIRHHLREAE